MELLPSPPPPGSISTMTTVTTATAPGAATTIQVPVKDCTERAGKSFPVAQCENVIWMIMAVVIGELIGLFLFLFLLPLRPFHSPFAAC